MSPFQAWGMEVWVEISELVVTRSRTESLWTLSWPVSRAKSFSSSVETRR